MFQDHTRYPCGIFQGVSVSLWAFMLLVYLQSSYSQNTHQEFKVLGQRALHHFPFLPLPRPRATSWTPRWPALFACSCEWNHSVKRQQNICTRYTLKSALCQINSKQLNVITKKKKVLQFWLSAKFIKQLNERHFTSTDSLHKNMLTTWDNRNQATQQTLMLMKLTNQSQSTRTLSKRVKAVTLFRYSVGYSYSEFLFMEVQNSQGTIFIFKYIDA